MGVPSKSSWSDDGLNSDYQTIFLLSWRAPKETTLSQSVVDRSSIDAASQFAGCRKIVSRGHRSVRRSGSASRLACRGLPRARFRSFRAPPSRRAAIRVAGPVAARQLSRGVGRPDEGANPLPGRSGPCRLPCDQCRILLGQHPRIGARRRPAPGVRGSWPTRPPGRLYRSDPFAGTARSVVQLCREIHHQPRP